MVLITRSAVATFLALAQIVAVVLAQSPSEIYTSSPSSSPSSTSSSASPFAIATNGIQVHIVTVGYLSWQFNPDTIIAKVGDVVQFQFFPPNHSVVRAEYEYPCIPYEMTGPHKTGFFSGFHYVPSVTEEPPLWNLTINDTSPIFFYCSAVGSCIRQQMVGVINPNEIETLDMQKAYAKNSTYMLNPGEPFPPEASDMASLTQVPTSTTSPAAVSSATAVASSAAPALASPSPHHSFPSEAIAGIAIGAVAVLVLCGALFFYMGRSKALEEVIDRKDGTVVTTSQVPPDQYMGGGYGHGYAPVQPHDFRNSNTSSQLPAYQNYPPAYQNYPPSSEANQSEFGSPVNEMAEKAELASPTRTPGPHELDGTAAVHQPRNDTGI